MPSRAFPQAFSLASSGLPAVKWSNTGLCRESTSFEGTYGLPTGARNGIWVLDLDVKDGKNGVAAMSAAIPEGEEIPDTYTVRTRSGGMHLYFLWNPERVVRNRRALLGEDSGVDVRGEGGFVRAGAGYPVLLDAPVAEAPEWLYDLVIREGGNEPGESAVAISPEHPEWSARLEMAREFIAAEPPCVSGRGGQPQLWKVALRTMRTYELPVDVVVSMLEGYNAKCEPPWTEAEIRRTLVRAAEYGEGPTGTFSSSFLAMGREEATVPAPSPEGPFRQVPNPGHEYSIDLAMACQGGFVKTNTLGAKDLAAAFTGPSAFPMWRGVWQYDAFRGRLVAVNPPFPLDAETRGLSGRDLSSIQVWMSCTGGKASTEAIRGALDVAGRVAEYHPVREYLASLEKVPVERAREYFSGIAGRLWRSGERDALESGHLRRLAIAAVRRIKAPGTKVDVMLILAGEQGFRKSLFCSKLFGEFFLDQLPPIQSGRGHEASIAIEGRWGVEVAELNALAHANESAKKDFITRCVDKYRPVFGIAMQEVPRQCVFIGTTNDDDFLTDPTGDTRYDICDIRHPISLDFDRDEFWACAVALEASGETHFRDRAKVRDVSSVPFFAGGDVAVVPMAEAAGFVSEHPWTDDVLRWAEGNAIETAIGWCITAKSCMKGLALPLERQDERALARVKGILRRRYGSSVMAYIDERSQRCYRVR